MNRLIFQLPELARALRTHGYGTAMGEIQLCCPYCLKRTGRPDRDFKLSVAPSGVFHCFRCGASGRDRGQSKHRATELPSQKRRFEPTSISELCYRYGFVGLDEAPDRFRAYWNSRGFFGSYDGSVLAAPDGFYRDRLVFPIYSWEPCSPDDDVIGFVARDITGEHKFRYMNSPGFDRKRSLWGAHLSASPMLVLCEGVINALAVYPHGLATLGSEVTTEQLAILDRAFQSHEAEFIVAFDGDAWERGRTLALQIALRGGPKGSLYYLHLPPKIDLADLMLAKINWEQYKRRAF